MKKFILFLMLVTAVQTQAQKTFVLYNLTANVVDIETLITSVVVNGVEVLPEYHMKPSGPISVAPFATYTLVNTASTTRFPFFSPTSVPAPTMWHRENVGGSSTVVPSNAAWLAGASQEFSWVQLRVGSHTKKVGTPASGESASVSGFGWTASYTLGGTTAAPIYTVTIL